MPELNAIEIICDQCGEHYCKPLRWIRANEALHCGCGCRTQLDSSYFKAHAEEMARRFDGFQRQQVG